MQDDAVCSPTAAFKDVLLRSAERRMMTLGSFYTDMQLSEELQQDAVQDVQIARMWEQQQIRRAVRRAELHAERMAAGRQAEEPDGFPVVRMLERLARDVRSRALALHLHNHRNNTNNNSSSSKKRREDVNIGGEGAPRVVLNINVGDGCGDRLVLRDSDDVAELAAAFVRRHGLPQSTIRTSVEEAQAALNEERK
ncbi:hypothetical protein LSM04_003783 [Trypanosoma melophagium]|uniref:uncharacterized protein n=1 Tax=Trypanosoma melophagium TaxID=715481 RepID=UPI00351A2446|nr:hypothetical protein LSM04_003783 [Trypanosoma melophagium]